MQRSTPESSLVRAHRYQPQTVSKAKQTSAAFFAQLMAFPKPKPRNIEKDVKVQRHQFNHKYLLTDSLCFAPADFQVVRTAAGFVENSAPLCRTMKTTIC